jgi:branched-chain amino acid transport system permease protein
MGGLDGPPKPPSGGSETPRQQPGRPSNSLDGPGAIGPITGIAVIALAALALPLMTRDSYYLDVATTILMNLTLTMSFRLQVSTGQINMAHISFMGIGAYTSALLVTRLGLSFWATLWIGALVAAALAVPIGAVALRVSGPYYFLITFASSEVVRLVFNNFFEGLFGGPSGLVGIPKPGRLGGLAFDGKLELYGLMAVLAVGVAIALVRLEYSRVGLVASAIRQADLLAETLGVNVFRAKLTTFVLGSFVAGLAGVFFAHFRQVLHSSDFGLEPMVLLVVFTVIGGTGSVWGPVVGTVLMTLAAELLRELHHYEILVFGAVLILTMLWAPQGLVALPDTVRRLLRKLRGRPPDALGARLAP